MTLRSSYDPITLEAGCREGWKQNDPYLPRPAKPGSKDTFVYACTPFTTGKAHMGHVRSYTIADVCARRARSKGDSVLWSMGFDAFGLPNEITAIENAIAPREWVTSCAERMRKQFDALGLSVDWTRCFVTSEPDYYRWTQWVFLRFLEKGLIYKARGIENWCETCKTVLATLQVNDNNRCWRCDNPVTLASVDQWYLRLLPYADELEEGLSDLEGWDEAIIASQRALLGKSVGAEFDVAFPSAPPLKVFTLYPSDISSAAFIALSPNHPYVDLLIAGNDVRAKLDVQRRRALSREDRGERIPFITTDLVLSVPGLAQKLPVIITVAVDMRFGGGAVLGIPSRDQSDAAVAEQLKLKSFDPVPNHPEINLQPATRYRLRDSSISRQRSWGAPVPIIHCSTCGAVPVPDSDLPVLLPDDLVPTGEGNALAAHPTFSHCLCPRCSSPAKRDTDTLDVHIDSIWMLVPFCVPAVAREEQMFTHPELQRWLPVSQVVCGVDQAGWWINDRLFFKVLKDCGYFRNIPEREPVREILMHEMVLSNGRKMSKSLGNVVDPEAVIGRYGADAVRLSVLRVSPHKAFSWTDEALQENYEFLCGIWTFVNEIFSRTDYPAPPPNDTKGVADRRKLARWCVVGDNKIGRAYELKAFHSVLKELKNLFAMIRKFAGNRKDNLSRADFDEIKIAVNLFLNLLEPLAPHISYALLKQIKDQEDAATVNEIVRPTAKADELRIAFVHTPMSTITVEARKDFWQNFDLRYHATHPGLRHMRYPLWELPHWMTWLAGVLVEQGYSNLAALDFYSTECALTGVNEKLVRESLLANPADVYLFSPMTPNLEFAFEIADIVKKVHPASKTVFGGVVATPMREYVAAHPSVDFVVAGRGEYALPRLLDAISEKLDLGEVGNLTYRSNTGELVSSNFSYAWMPLEDLPFPKVDLFPKETGLDLRYLRQVYSLGCPYLCQFCTIQTIGRKASYFPIERVLAEIRAYRNHYGEHNIYFGDETFTANTERTLDLCHALEREGHIFYDCQTRLNLLKDERMLKAMERSGCRWVEIGIESVNQQTQDLFKQRVKLNPLRETLKSLQGAGLPACSFLVNGFPNQTVDDMRRSIDFVGELIEEGLLQASYLFGLVPYPGSDLYRRPEQFGMTIHHHDYKLYHEDMLPVFHTQYASAEEIYEVFLYGLKELGRAMSLQPYFGNLPTMNEMSSFGSFWQSAHV